MENPSAIAAEVLSYLRRSVLNNCNLTERGGQGIKEAAVNHSTSNSVQPVQEESRNHDGSVPETGREKRKRSPSPLTSCQSEPNKQEKFKSNSSGISSGNGKDLNGTGSLPLECESHETNESSQDVDGDATVRLNSIINRLLWTLKYLHYNPSKSSDEALEMVGNLCSGLEKSINLSRLNFTDENFKRFITITETLFRLIKSCEDDCPLIMLKIVDTKAENLFDHFLDNFGEDADGEGHLRTYGFLTLLVDQVKSEQKFLKQLVKKLLIRLYSATTALWEAYISCSKSMLLLVDSEDISLFFYYCQLLELLGASQQASTNKNYLRELVYESLTALNADAGSLFSLLPNMAYVLYSTILATDIQTKSSDLAVEVKSQ